MKKHYKLISLLLTGVMLASLLTGCGNNTPLASNTQNNIQNVSVADPDTSVNTDTLVIAEQGIFSAGGTITASEGTFDVANYYTSREGSTSHVDHANVLYQIPANDTGLPMVFLHGYGQSRMGWMTTPDGREGWSNIFLRKGHSVWLIDQPRRGEAGQTSVAGTITTEPSDQTWYTQFRIGTYLNNAFTYNEGSQFPKGDEALDQFFRQMTPDTAMDSVGGDQNIDNALVARAVAAAIDEVYERTGKNSILVTHSQGGGPGWEAAKYTNHIAAIVAIEPGGAPAVDSEEYTVMLDKKIPVAIYYGDYIGEDFPDVPASTIWGFMSSSADTFTEAYNQAGAACTLVRLPDEGITGNDHFMFQDLNNDVIADHVESWIQATEMADSTEVDTQQNVSVTSDNEQNGGTLVVYYSATGSTEAVANTIAEATNGTLFALIPVESYSNDDLNWRDNDSRVSVEHDNPDQRNVELIAATAENWDSYDTVFIGYPVWWGIAAWPVDTFIKANDFTGKTVIPFCTSSSSGLGESGKLLAEMAGTGDWKEGQRFQSSVSASDVTDWVNGLEMNK